MLCHILLAFHGIKDLQGRIFDVVAMIFAAAIAIRNAAGCVDDIIQKAVGRRDLFFALWVKKLNTTTRNTQYVISHAKFIAYQY